jgi:chromosome segregation protein
VQIEIAQLQKEHSSTQESHLRLTRESEEKRKGIEHGDIELAGFRARVESLERQLHEMLQEESKLRELLSAALDEADKARREEEALQASSSEIRVREASATQKAEHLSLTLSRLESEVAQIRELALRRENEARSAASEQEALVRKNDSLEEALKQIFARRDEAKQEVVNAAELRQEHLNAVQDLERQMREKRAEISLLSEQRHGSEMRAQEGRLRVAQLQETLRIEYHVEMGSELQEDLGLSEAEEAELKQETIDDLKRKVEELGIVNPAAAEEYRELEQRHSLLVGQLEDLRSAKNDLAKVIAKINQESRERFIQTFEKVHESFKRIFKTLFGGGEAKLTLMEEGDLLEAGIDIIARPPGKRQQSISLLSGGEKALTAIALLFALFETKPSPFCVLDEIDAPLDDANISRFSKLLKEYAGKSQFIVITHSKITMEMADILYGITMEEAGVSRIISAKFKESKAALA